MAGLREYGCCILVRMQKMFLFVVCFASIVLAGCQAQPTSQASDAVASSQVYEGYPCYEHCSEFKQGFTLAKQQTYTQPSQCDHTGLSERVGCLAWVQEYKAEHESDFKL